MLRKRREIQFLFFGRKSKIFILRIAETLMQCVYCRNSKFYNLLINFLYFSKLNALFYLYIDNIELTYISNIYIYTFFRIIRVNNLKKAYSTSFSYLVFRSPIHHHTHDNILIQNICNINKALKRMLHKISLV